MIWRTHLCKVFADVLGSGAQIVAEGTGIASLTGALTEELARYVGRVYHEACVSRGDIGRNDRGGSCATYSEGFGAHRSGERVPWNWTVSRWRR